RRSFFRRKGGEQVADLLVHARRIIQGTGDLLAQQIAILPAETMDRDLDRTSRHGQLVRNITIIRVWRLALVQDPQALKQASLSPSSSLCFSSRRAKDSWFRSWASYAATP